MVRLRWQMLAVGLVIVAGLFVGGIWHYEHATAKCPANRRVVTADDAGRVGYGCFPAPAGRPLHWGGTWFYD